ncbi:Tetratricopeptide repeat family [Mycena venus]|uniref:Tetratricopeptide repeat family n=1 Tax=Mycena venus TaxID=2733690 RepID=A0A8H6YGM0_9AGAR|nr:Tetratricopeptide repeat family [Mycena venus]
MLRHYRRRLSDLKTSSCGRLFLGELLSWRKLFVGASTDLIDVAQSIKRSIEKTRENRRRIRDLTDDVLRTLADLADLTRGKEDTFQAPALLSALGNLKAEMLHVLSLCYEMSPAEQRGGIRALGSHIKIWIKREDLEMEIGRLKEHVNKCYLQFTAFAAARIEQTSVQVAYTTLRVEQSLILNNVENQVRLRRLEGMMARVLLETQFGQSVMDQTIEIISADLSHSSLESQYLTVQAMRLIDSIRHLTTRGSLVLDSSVWESMRPLQLLFLQSASPSRVLQWILIELVEIHENPTGKIQVEILAEILFKLGVHLVNLGKTSEAIAWELLKIDILRSSASRDWSAAILAQLAHSLYLLSWRYQSQLQYRRALQASQQSLDLWHHLSESLPDVDHRASLLTATIVHAENLFHTGQKTVALCIAQEAADLSRRMVEQLLETCSEPASLTEETEFKAVRCCEAYFNLAHTLSSVGRHFESYQVFVEGFQTILKLPVSTYPPSGTDVDMFIDQACRVAEGDGFSLAMLADCVILFRNLARIHPENLSSQFLLVLYAYVFVELNPDCPPPPLDITATACIDDFNIHGGIVNDAVQAFYTCPWQTSTTPLIRNIFITHFEEAIGVLRETVINDSTTIIWDLYSILDILSFVTKPRQLALLKLMTKIIRQLLVQPGAWEQWSLYILNSPFVELWRFGLLDDALEVSNQGIQYLSLSPKIADNMNASLLDQAFLLCDMGRILEAVQLTQKVEKMLPGTALEGPTDVGYWLPCIIKTRILRRAGRNQEALRLLASGVADGGRRYLTDDSDIFEFYLYFLLVELATIQGILGCPGGALQDAERAVSACRGKVAEKFVDGQMCTLVHALTTLSNCLAVAERNEEALAFAYEAVSIYTENASKMWEDFLYTIRKAELGANAFHTLSQRLALSGKLEQALINASKATDLYRELVELAPRHLPTLASSLQDRASILWEVGRCDEAIAACEEAVAIIRKIVDPEVYFLAALAEALEQLAVYLTEKGDVISASAATAEYGEVRRTFASLPSETEFLFERVVTESDEDDEEAPSGSEKDDNYDDASEALKSAEGPDTAHAATTLPESPGEPTVENLPEGSCIDAGEIRVAAGDKVIPSAAHASSVELEVLSPAHKTSVASESPDEGPSITETAPSAKKSLTDVLSKPLEVRLSSTPMDILWWILLGILFNGYSNARISSYQQQATTALDSCDKVPDESSRRLTPILLWDIGSSTP